MEMNKMRKILTGSDCPIVLSEEFIAVDNDNVDFDDENEVSNAAPIPKSSKMRNVLKTMCSYLDAHYNGKKKNKMDDITQFLLKT
ncbi:hypothetical protein TNCV_2966451 [Trichonephila clavipes]|nr:hypothetical protein TNCV_2966451 [Trichonephila clavipes]